MANYGEKVDLMKSGKRLKTVLHETMFWFYSAQQPPSKARKVARSIAQFRTF